MTTNPKYIAGWNLPGCIPEMEPAEFDTLEEARDFLLEEINWAYAPDDPTDPSLWAAVRDEIHNKPEESPWNTPDGYVWWIEIPEEPG